MTNPVADVDAAFADAVTARMAEIETQLHEAALADSPFVSEAATHIIAAGGKRFRPLLVCLGAAVGRDLGSLTGDAGENLRRAALVVELTHVASLYHDDVMDEAETRRGAPSANERWGNNIAIMVGDYLFARASSIVATLGVDYVALQAETFARLVQGQIAETRGPAEGADPLQHYLDVVADKTGSLIATSARFGGMVGGCSDEVIDALARFGEEIGTVFQLSDDIIDITSDTTGKTPGTDLREGVATLPTLMLRARAGQSDAELVSLLDGDLSRDEDLARALGALRAHPVIDEARAEVARRAESARAALTPLPEGEAKRALAALCRTVVERSA